MSRALRLGLILLVLFTAAASAGAATANPAGSAARDAKRGIASARYLSSDPAKLAQLGASWASDWSASPPPRTRSLQWVPMLWGSGSVTPSTIADLRAEKRAGRVRYLLGFNEPDSTSQSNLSPRQAAALWPKLEQTGLVLGSPAPAVPTDGWLARFMGLVRHRHLRLDFIALHYYQDFTDPRSVSSLHRQLTRIHAEYHLPIWITEIGAIDIRTWGEPMAHQPTAQRAAAYIRKLFTMLDSMPFVRRYAWFTDGCWSDPSCRSGSLFDSAGHLTAAGRAFEQAR